MKPVNQKPPRVGGWFLKVVTRYEDNLTLWGDFDEEFASIAGSEGYGRAWFWYWGQLIRSLPAFLKDFIYWGFAMFQNYLKITWRNIRRHKAYSFINLTGLAIGMACCIFILMWVKDELSFDIFHENSQNIYHIRLWTQQGNVRENVAASPPALGPALREEYPEILQMARINNGQAEMVLQYGSKQFIERVQMADPEIFEVFSFPFVKGIPESAFSDPHGLVLSEDAAKKIFGNRDPLDEIITIDNQYDFRVVGVMANIPHNSTISFDVWVPLSFSEEVRRPNYTQTWYNASFQTYLLLLDNVSPETVSQKIRGRIQQSNRRTNQEPFLVPFRNNYKEFWGAKDRILIFSLIAAFVLLIACINFINLTTARSAQRAKEVGLRKVVGAHRQQLIKQFFGESLLLTVLALFLALLFIALCLPVVRNLTGKPLALNYLMGWGILAGIIGITFLTGLVSGIYPSLLLSAAQPVHILKGRLHAGTRGSLFRKILVVTQFVFSIILIISATVVQKQVQYMRNTNLGFEKERLLYLEMRGELRQNFEAARSELLKNPGIQNVTFVSRPPTYIGTNGRGWEWEGKDPNVDPLVTYMAVYPNFLETFGAEMAEGQFFKEGEKNRRYVVINERLAEIMGMENPIGKSLREGLTQVEIKGIIKNFHFLPLHYEIGPMMLYYGTMGSFLDFRFMFIKLDPENMSATLSGIEKTIKKFNPGYPFDYRFLDEEFNRMYRTEERISSLVRTFTFLAIFVSCLGLFGLASYMAERRTKEIGIRKVLGATVSRIVYILTREFVTLILVANLFAWPVAYFIMHQLLQNFAYRVRISPWFFVLSGLGALLIALLTVSYQSIKAALVDPVESLRYE